MINSRGGQIRPTFQFKLSRVILKIIKKFRLDPTLSKPFGSGADLSQFGFSPCSNCVLVGDSEGTISVYQVRGLDKNNDENDMLSLVQASLNTH